MFNSKLAAREVMMPTVSQPISKTDLDEVFSNLKTDMEQLRNARIFVTGGTGFFGTWLLETLLDANRRMNLGIQVGLLTRNAERWTSRFPHLASETTVTPIDGDVRFLDRNTHPMFNEKFDLIVHAAFDSGQLPSTQTPWNVLETILSGTKSVLDISERSGAKRLMFVSSGAVYGPQPPGISHLKEDFSGGPDISHPDSAYGEGKRAAELLAITHAQKHGYACVIARGFAFVGPHLPLDVHFAAGNFLNDVLNGRDITIKGDGTPLRTYLYAADMAWWLWTILIRGTPGRAYNVGSSHAVSIGEVANQVAKLSNPQAKVHILKPPTVRQRPHQYVPDVTRAQEELGLSVRVPWEEAFRRTFEYYRANQFK